MSITNVWEVPINDNMNIPNNSAIPWDWDKWTSPNFYNWTVYPTTIYKYQITCPKCKKMNWLELDKIQECSRAKCGAMLKAVSIKADYEIAVNE